jgi:hypothetical protein
MPERTGATEARLELAGRVAVLRARGMMQREIAAELGIPRSWAAELCNDPDGSRARARKDRLGLPCPRCGTRMTGSEGRGTRRAPKLCQACSRETPANKIWTRETVVAAFQHFERVVGRPPTTVDRANIPPSVAAHLSAERIAEGQRAARLVPLPAPGTVAALFGSWAAALAAAGFEPNGCGEPSHRRPRTRKPRLLQS